MTHWHRSFYLPLWFGDLRREKEQLILYVCVCVCGLGGHSEQIVTFYNIFKFVLLILQV